MSPHLGDDLVHRDDTLVAEFFAAARSGELLLQRCRACGETQFFPRTACRTCHAVDVEWIRSAGKGTVYSFTRVHRPTVPGDADRFVVLLVSLAEGPRVLCRAARSVVDAELAIGDEVQLDFERDEGDDSDEGLRLVAFPVASPAASAPTQGR